MKLHAAAVKSHYDVKTHNPGHHGKDHSYDDMKYPEEFPCRLCGRWVGCLWVSVFLFCHSRDNTVKVADCSCFSW